MRSHPTRAALLTLAISVALLAGCGTSSGSDAADRTTTSTAGATTEAGSSTTEADATTTEADVTTTTAATDDDGICGPLQDVKDFDAEANGLVAGGNWADIQAFYVDKTDDIIATYDEAIGYDSEITPELKTLREVTVSAGDLAESSKDLMDFSSKLLAQPGLAESSTAALKASEFSQETCGFPLAGL